MGIEHFSPAEAGFQIPNLEQVKRQFALDQETLREWYGAAQAGDYHFPDGAASPEYEQNIAWQTRLRDLLTELDQSDQETLAAQDMIAFSMGKEKHAEYIREAQGIMRNLAGQSHLREQQ